MKEDKFNGIPIIKIILLFISIIGIWFIWKEWLRRKKIKENLIGLLTNIKEALYFYKQRTNFDLYFAYYDEQEFYRKFLPLLSNISKEYPNLGLDINIVNEIDQFVYFIENLPVERKKYNNLFVEKEAEKYLDFFEKLEKYPLSTDQIEAVLRDEDNNLVVAGAGTGKTTTISAKVAYILKKGLAKPEELLIISFTRNAVSEMYSRTVSFCKGLLGDKNTLDVRTFNSFGNMVTNVSTRKDANLAFDGNDAETKAFLQEMFDQLYKEDKNFQSKAINFIAFFSRPERDEFAFASGNDFMKHESSFKNITLDGKKVKSKEEMEIGNFLYLFKINYEYEKVYPLDEKDRDYSRAQYRPDFYLTDYEIWHEHYGINEKGEVPSWFSFHPPYNSANEYYNSLITWKDNIHKKYQSKLIKTYSFESKNGCLITNLKKQLDALGIKMQKRSPDEILNIIHKSEHYEDFMDMIYTFLNLMKSNNKRPDYFLETINDKRLNVFLDVFKPLYAKYQAKLESDNAIDYNDMVNKATFHISKGDFYKRYKYIMVDEFQDMSLGRYQLLQSIKQANPGAKLYAVGDDWQSIYRFTGSDISIITQFEAQFGFTYESHILRTYRFNEKILELTSRFIQKNPSQIQKQLTSQLKANDISFSFFGLDFTRVEYLDYRRIKFEKINEVLTIIENDGRGNVVYLIGRYHHNKPESFETLKFQHPNLELTYYTSHGVKGLTCDFAIILDVDGGKYGFPSEVADDPILNYLLYEGDAFDNAEERRVFYVGLTRARHHNFLLFNQNNASKFIDELVVDNDIVSPFSENIICQLCKGRMVKRNSNGREFYGCTNYPQCKGILKIK